MDEFVIGLDVLENEKNKEKRGRILAYIICEGITRCIPTDSYRSSSKITILDSDYIYWAESTEYVGGQYAYPYERAGLGCTTLSLLHKDRTFSRYGRRPIRSVGPQKEVVSIDWHQEQEFETVVQVFNKEIFDFLVQNQESLGKEILQIAENLCTKEPKVPEKGSYESWLLNFLYIPLDELKLSGQKIKIVFGEHPKSYSESSD